jgi:hypothetical protein
MPFKPFILTNETLEAQKEALLELLHENEAKIEKLLAQQEKSYASFVTP